MLMEQTCISLFSLFLCDRKKEKRGGKERAIFPRIQRNMPVASDFERNNSRDKLHVVFECYWLVRIVHSVSEATASLATCLDAR